MKASHDVTVEHRSGLQIQETQYDPAGLELAGLTPPSPGIRGLNNYRFNGKEFQADLGLNWNHQDWRFFDPQLLRWHSVDPEVENGQESWSPYSFGYDNAVRYADANGRAPDCCGGGGPDGDGWGQAALNYVGGVINAMASNSTTVTTGFYGQTVSGVERHASPSLAYTWGQQAGDIVSVAQGLYETATGLGMATGGTVGGTVTAPTVGGAIAGYSLAVAGVGLAVHGVNTTLNGGRNLLGDNNGRVYSKSTTSGSETTKGAAKGSLSQTKKALAEAKAELGLKPNESLPKGETGKFGSPQRGTSKKGYRLDPSHPNAKPGSGEEFPHVNFWDYTSGKRGNGGNSGAIPIK